MLRDRVDLEVNALKIRINALEAGREALMDENLRLQRLADKYTRAGEFYLRMQQLILKDENIRDAWLQFYTFLCLAAPDINELNKETYAD